MRARFSFLIILAAAIALDLLSKWAVFKSVGLGQVKPVIPGIVQFRPIFNPGAVFGVLPGAAPLFVIISLIAAASILWLLSTKQGKPLLTQSTLALILAGIVGNLYDRLNYVDPRFSSPVNSLFDYLKHGAVRDFIDFYGIWPCFNAADAFICVGVGLALLQFVIFGEKKKEAAPEETADASPTQKV